MAQTKTVTEAKSESKETKAPVRTAAADAPKYKLIIPRDIMDKIMWWMHKTNKEVSGFGSLEFNAKTSTFKVKDAILLKQEVDSASTEIDPIAMNKAMFRMKDEPMGLKWHWHSHVKMGVFWSNDDMEIIRSLGQRGWILATVFNYAEESKTAYLTQVQVQAPDGNMKPQDIFIDDIETKVINYVPSELYEAWDKEYDENVKEAKWVGSYTHYKGQKDWVDLDDEEFFNNYRNGTYNGNYSPLDCDDNGWAKVMGFRTDHVYNPVFDKELKTREDRILAIFNMDQDEIEFVAKRSPAFELLKKEFLVMCAGLKEEVEEAGEEIIVRGKKSQKHKKTNEPTTLLEGNFGDA